MRKVSLLLSIVVMVSMLLVACGAEETGTSVPSPDVPPVTVDVTATEPASMTETVEPGDMTTTPVVPVTGEDSVSRLSNLLDLDVWNQNNEQVGEVEDMVLDIDNSNIAYVVIETGGFLDIGDKTVLIPWASLDLQTTAEGATETAFVLNADAEMLNNAPDMDLDAVLPAMNETTDGWDADIRNFWESGVMPEATEATGDATATLTTDATMPESTATSTTDSGAGAGTDQAELQGVILASDVLGATITVSQGEAQEGSADATVEPAPTADLSTTPEATAAGSTDAGMGTENTGPTEATIEDVIVDPDAGDILYLVLNSLFDDGERWIPVPFSTLNWDATNESFLFVTNSNALQSAPFFEADQWPDTTADGWDTEFDTFWQTNVTTTP